MTANDFREMALGFDDAEESVHMGAADFRVGGRIFATLAHEHLGFGNLMLSPELQQSLIAEAPEVFLPVSGGWGRMGAPRSRGTDSMAQPTTSRPGSRGAATSAATSGRPLPNRRPDTLHGSRRPWPTL